MDCFNLSILIKSSQSSCESISKLNRVSFMDLYRVCFIITGIRFEDRLLLIYQGVCNGLLSHWYFDEMAVIL